MPDPVLIQPLVSDAGAQRISVKTSGSAFNPLGPFSDIDGARGRKGD
ncbi:MAG: hypothetical protein HY343_00955 [Lentisphaerae bacterium]|nr:hypothetical protein [Lentisphaerota bacterium]